MLTKNQQYGGSIRKPRSLSSWELSMLFSEAVGASRVAIRLSPSRVFLRNFNPGVSTYPPILPTFIADLRSEHWRASSLLYISLVDPRVTFDNQQNEIYTQHSNDFVRQIWNGVIVKASGFNYESAKAESW